MISLVHVVTINPPTGWGSKLVNSEVGRNPRIVT
jgi:hypothetical protein